MAMGYNEIYAIFIQLRLLSCTDTGDIEMPIVSLKLQTILTIYKLNYLENWHWRAVNQNEIFGFRENRW